MRFEDSALELRYAISVSYNPLEVTVAVEGDFDRQALTGQLVNTAIDHRVRCELDQDEDTWRLSAAASTKEDLDSFVWSALWFLMGWTEDNGDDGEEDDEDTWNNSDQCDA